MEKSTFLILILKIFSKYTECDSTVIYIQAGEVAKLIFQYPCDSTEVTLRHGYQIPFYNSANPDSNSMPPNKHVSPVNQNRSGIEKCSIHLTINPVSRDDVGTYILTVYKNGVMLPDYPRIGLRVNYPPGKASCESSNDYNDGEWVSLHCTAPLGTISGHIICYQNGMKLPSLTQPVENREILIQVILVRSAYPVYCCSNILKNYTDICDCTDCCWEPIHNIQCTDIHVSDPCPFSLSTQEPTFSNDHTNTDPTLPSTPETATESSIIQDICKCLYPNYALYISIGILSIAIMILAVMCIILRLRKSRNLPLTNKQTKSRIINVYR